MWNGSIHSPQFTAEVTMFDILFPAAIAVLAAWGVAAAIVVSLRDGYRQVPTR